MIEQKLKVRDEHINRVFGFCYLYGINIRNYDHKIVMIDGEADNMAKLLNYIDRLERERLVQRKKKSFWWRLWN